VQELNGLQSSLIEAVQKDQNKPEDSSEIDDE
jgi:hypothetical protein